MKLEGLNGELNEYTYSKQDVADVCGVTKGTIDNWRKAGYLRGEFLKLGRRVWFRNPEQVRATAIMNGA